MTKRLFLAAGGLLLVLVTLGVVHFLTTETIVSVNYPDYRDVGELVSDSPLVVKGKILDQKKDVEIMKVVPFDVDWLTYLNHEVEVEEVFLGSPLGPGEEILVRTYYGEEAMGLEIHQEQSPIEYVLFLKPSEDGVYHITGGPRGVFEINGNQVRNLRYREIDTMEKLKEAIAKARG